MENKKLIELAIIEGFENPMALIEANATDSVVPGICKNCDYSCGVEPDQAGGWCENCETQTVVSCLVLAGMI